MNRLPQAHLPSLLYLVSSLRSSLSSFTLSLKLTKVNLLFPVVTSPDRALFVMMLLTSVDNIDSMRTFSRRTSAGNFFKEVFMRKGIKIVIALLAWLAILACALMQLILAVTAPVSRPFVFVLAAVILSAAVIVPIFNPAFFAKRHTSKTGT